MKARTSGINRKSHSRQLSHRHPRNPPHRASKRLVARAHSHLILSVLQYCLPLSHLLSEARCVWASWRMITWSVRRVTTMKRKLGRLWNYYLKENSLTSVPSPLRSPDMRRAVYLQHCQRQSLAKRLCHSENPRRHPNSNCLSPSLRNCLSPASPPPPWTRQCLQWSDHRPNSPRQVQVRL